MLSAVRKGRSARDAEHGLRGRERRNTANGSAATWSLFASTREKKHVKSKYRGKPRRSRPGKCARGARIASEGPFVIARRGRPTALARVNGVASRGTNSDVVCPR